jgi:DNA modification methylase
MLVKSIEHYGWTNPVLVQAGTNRIIAGHGRVEAAKAIGKTEVPVIVLDMDDRDAKAYLVADNQLATLSEWDMTALKDILADLDDGSFDMDLTGFDDEALDALMAVEVLPTEGLTDPDDVGEPPDDPITKPGDLIILGRHRLLCGDSTVITDVERLMDGKRSEICFTSPPYNAGSLNITGNESTMRKYNAFDDNKSESEYFDFLTANINAIMSVSDEVFYNIGIVENNKRVIIDVLSNFRDQFKDIIYWNKDTTAPHIQPGFINNKVEFILCFGNGKRKFMNAQFSQGTYYNVISGPNASGNEYAKIHKATFPVYLPDNIIRNFSSPESIVLDAFGGSGTTMIAAEQTGRTAYLMEFDPKYCDVIVNRWEKFTGLKAERPE